VQGFLGKVVDVAHGDATDRLAHQTRQLGDLIDEKRALWDDEGGKTTLHRYLRPHREAADELVAALRERDQLLAALEAEIAISEQELEAAEVAHRRTEEAVARAVEDVRSADDDLSEVFKEEAVIADLEARGLRFANLATGYRGDREPRPAPFDRAALERFRAEMAEQRHAQLSELQESFTTLGVQHVLEGEFNANGRFTGFHSALSNLGRILVEGPPDTAGVYQAIVAGRRSNDIYVLKHNSRHTMFPRHWSEERMCYEVLEAHSRLPADKKANSWRNIGPSGIPIAGHVRYDGSIIGYPVREEP
jgi:hypothetical protein